MNSKEYMLQQIANDRNIDAEFRKKMSRSILEIATDINNKIIPVMNIAELLVDGKFAEPGDAEMIKENTLLIRDYVAEIVAIEKGRVTI